MFGTALGRLFTVMPLLAACDPMVTSVGAWSPNGGGSGLANGGSGALGTGGALSAGGALGTGGVRSAGGSAGVAGALSVDGYLEAENGELSGGFVTMSDATASNGAYLLAPTGQRSEDAPGPERARYRFVVREAKTFVIWGRIRSLDAIHNRFWFHVDDGTWYKWRISVGDIWFWDDLHDNTNYGTPLTFDLGAGEHSLEFANCADQVELDRLYITSTGDTPPGNTTSCNPPHSIEVQGKCLPSCGSLGGTACSEAQCAGLPQIDAYDCGICCHVN